MALYRRAELDKMNEVSPELQEALRKRPMPDLPSREARAAHLRTLRHLMPVPGPVPDQVTEQTHAVPARDGHDIPVISYIPAQQSEPGPLVVLYHEGGWSQGDPSDEEFNARRITHDLGATCLNVDYRLAPEHPFPIGINDCWDVILWAVKNTQSLKTDPTKGFIVGGSSAGGNISAVLAHQSRIHKLQPQITGQWLSAAYLIPSIRVPEKYQAEYTSMTESTNDPVLVKADDASPNSWVMQAVRPDLDSPLWSVVSNDIYPPNEANYDSKTPLAPAFIQVCGLDPLRDHALIYDRILREEYAVKTKLKIYSGLGHMFWTNWPEMETSSKFSEDMIDGIKWLLDQQSESAGT